MSNNRIFGIIKGMNFDDPAYFSNDLQRPNDDLFMMRFTLRHIFFIIKEIHKSFEKSTNKEIWFGDAENILDLLKQRAYYLRGFVKDPMLVELEKALPIWDIEKLSDEEWNKIVKLFNKNMPIEDDIDIEPHHTLIDVKESEYKLIKGIIDKIEIIEGKDELRFKDWTIMFRGKSMKITNPFTIYNVVLKMVIEKKGSIVRAESVEIELEYRNIIEPNDDAFDQCESLNYAKRNINKKMREYFGIKYDFVEYSNKTVKLNKRVKVIEVA